ncbi:MAG TPA: glycerophosphodiester phosphodiesterase [Gaiellaceae bacterium]
MNLRRAGGPPLVIGHRGAAARAPENTLASLQAAVAARADLVEFDVGPDLVLAHSRHERPADLVPLDDALAYLASAGVGVHLDAKETGYEEELVAALRRHGLATRAVVSTAFGASTRRLAALAPDVPRAIGYPHDRYRVSRFRWPGGLTRAAAGSLRLAMPRRLPLLLRQSRANVLSLHHTLCSPAAVAVSHRVGAPVLVWTVNDPASVARLAGFGVDAIVSDDPEMARETLGTLHHP